MNKHFQKIYFDPYLFFSLFLLSGLGLFFLFSASNADFSIVLKQFIYVVAGFFIMILVSQPDPDIFRRTSGFFLIFSFLLLGITYLFGPEINGAQRWVRIGSFSFQSSELLKLSVPIFLASFLFNKKLPIQRNEIFISLIIIVFCFFVVFRQPDLGTALIILILGLVAIFYAGIKLIYPLFSLILMALVSPFLWTLLKPYQQNRILIFLNPDLDPLGKGYHIIQSKIAIGSGGLNGNGFLEGSQSSLDFLPEKETDFVFAIFSEQFGFTGSLILISIFLIFFLIPIFKTFKLTQVFNKIILFVLSFKIFFEFLINISMTIGLLPVVGVALPFMSYGGSSLLSNMIICALLMNLMSVEEKKRMFS